MASEDFEQSIPLAPNSYALRRLLRLNETVRALTTAIAEGRIPEELIQEKTSEIVTGMTPGISCPNQLSLAAFAVALEQRQSAFADQYLSELAALRVEELRDAIEVARECLRSRRTLAANKFKYFGLAKTATQSRVIDQPSYSATLQTYEALPTSVVRERLSYYG